MSQETQYNVENFNKTFNFSVKAPVLNNKYCFGNSTTSTRNCPARYRKITITQTSALKNYFNLAKNWSLSHLNFSQSGGSPRKLLGQTATEFERFVNKLEKNWTQLCKKYNCKRIEFEVYEKNGKAALKAKPCINE